MFSTKYQKIFKSGPFMMVLAGGFFSIMAAMVKEVSLTIPLFQITFFRAIVSALLIGAILYRKKLPLLGENRKVLMIRAVSGFTAMCLNFYSISKIGLGDAAVLHQCAPIFVILLSWMFLHEKMHRPLLLVTLFSFSGVILIFRPNGDVFNLAGLAGISSAVFAATAYVAIRHLHQSESFWTVAFYFMITATLLSFFPMLLSWKTPNFHEWTLLLFSGLFGTLGQLLITYAYKMEEASWVAPFSYTGVLFSFGIGILYFKESPDPYTLLGAFLTVAGGIWILKLKAKYQKKTPPVLEEETTSLTNE